MIYLLLFIFATMTPLDLQTLQSSHKNDYRYYQIEKHGSKFTNIAHSHVIPAVAILGISVYQSLKYKNMFSLEKLPQLLAPMSAGYIGERVIELLGKREERLAKQSCTNNYRILKNCFEILEKEPSINQQDFLEQYHQKTNSDLAIYEKINRIIFEKNDNFILPEKINRESELNVSLLKKSEEEAKIAQLTRKKIEAELAEKDIIKIFKFETYNQATEVRTFYGWEDYTKEKAAAVASKIKEGKVIKESAILYGAPGCGKTSYVENVTKAIATKSNQDVIFYNIKNADLKTKTQNSATAHINQLFEQVFKKAETVPVVVFFDEFDGISTKRESIEQENHNKIDHQNNDVTALLLQKIEEAAGKKNILIFAATNHIENMDDALIRTGRFDYRIHIGKPNVEMRTEIIKKIFSNSKEEELNILLHLTSSQTTVDVANTVKKYLEFKREKNKIEKEKEEKEKEEEEEKIELFAKHAIQAQKSRQKSHIDDSKINEWIEKTKEENSIQKLIETEQKNSEIVSIQAIEDQEKYPSLKCNLEGLVSSEKINESHQEKMLKNKEKALELQKKSYEEQKVLSGIVQKLLEEINNKSQKEITNLESFNNKLDIIANRISSLTDKKSEEINAITRIATPLENIYDLQQMKKYLDKTAKAFAAINIQSQAELGFNYRKNIILEYFKQFEKEFDRFKKEDAPVAKNTLLYLLLLFTDKFSYAELHLVLQDLFINRFYAPSQAEVNRAVDEKIFLTNKNNHIALHSLVIKESGSLQATMTERKSFEQRMRCQLSSFKEVLTIFQTYAFRILLREKIFQNKYNPWEEDGYGIFETFMKNTTKQIESLINERENDQALDEKIQNIILNFTLKSDSADDRNETRKKNLTSSNPNSYIQLSTVENIINFLTTMEIENIGDVTTQLKKLSTNQIVEES